MRALLVTAGLLATACSGYPPPCGRGGFGGGGGVMVGTEPIYSDAAAVEAVLSLSAWACRPLEEVRVDVRDPLNRPIEATATLTAEEPPTARISFVPAVPGRYHVVATFQPNLGMAQTDLFIYRDQTARMQTLPGDCFELQSLPSGALLCDAQLYRDGVAQGALAFGSQSVVAGAVVWEVTDVTVRRFADSGEGPLVESGELQTSSSRPAIVQQMLATENELIVLGSARVQRFLWRDGAIVESPEQQLDGAIQAAVRTPSGLVFIESEGSEALRACPWRIDAEELQPAGDCSSLPGERFGVEADALWLVRRPTVDAGTPLGEPSLIRVTFDDHGRAQSLHATLPRGARLIPSELRTGGAPAVLMDGFTWLGPRFEDDRVVLELLGMGSEATVGRYGWGVKHGLLWFDQQHQQTRWVPRGT